MNPFIFELILGNKDSEFPKLDQALFDNLMLSRRISFDPFKKAKIKHRSSKHAESND